MEFVVIEKKEWQELIERLSSIETTLNKIAEGNTAKVIQQWIPLIDFLKASTISKASWYREYQYKIKHRN